jgi:hypothetical protein
MKTIAKKPKIKIEITKSKIKLITDHSTTKTAPTLNKTKGANRKNNPKAKIPFKTFILIIYNIRESLAI